MKYKLMAVDIDGTLLNSKHELTGKTKEAIEKAVKKDIIFTLSTGRPVHGIKFLSELLNFNKDFPVITYNGAMVVMSKSGKVLYDQKLKEKYVNEIESLCKENGTHMIIWSDNNLYMTEENAYTMDYQKILNTGYTIVENFREIARGGITKAIWIDETEKIKKLQGKIQEHFGGTLNCHTSRPYLLEFVDKNASKAVGMEKIGEYYNIDKSEMIAAGDGYNDISMIKYAGLGVVMGNAPNDIKEIADFVTLTNDEDGLAYVINKFVL